MKHSAKFFAIAFAGALLTGCTPRNDAPAAVSSSAVSTADAAPEPVAESSSRQITYPITDYQSPGPGKPGGTLRVSVATDPGTLDFQLITQTNAKWLGRLLFDNLVYLDEQGGYVPWLAKSWTISPDGKTYIFKLREGVTFSDGEKFNAEAVRVNLARMRDPATRTGMTTAYLAPYVDGVVIDDYTFQANLSEPYTAFLNVLAQSWLGLYSPKALRENPKALAERPAGSGPFVVESYRRQEHLRLVRRPDYRWAPPFLKHDGPAYLERIDITFVPEPLIRYNSLIAGDHDFTIDVPPQNAAALRDSSDYVVRSRVNLGNPTRALTFNVEKFPFDDLRVRRAFALAVDRVGIEHITGFGEYRLKTDFLSAITRYYDPGFQQALRYDPAAAARILDEAGWTARDPDGIRTKDGRRLSAEILTSEATGSSAIPVALQSDVKKIGFDLRILQLPATQATERRRAGAYQCTSAGFWHTNTPDGLYIVYHGKQVDAGFAGQNTSRLRDPELDDLLSRARHATDPALLPGLYRRAQERLVEIVPAVPLYENHTLVAYKNGVRGVVFDTSHNTPLFTTVWLDR